MCQILRKIYNSDTTNICKKFFSGGNVHITAQGYVSHPGRVPESV
jgi:hypothetical protein